MFAKLLVTDRWHGRRNDEGEVDQPSAADIEMAIGALDAEERTLVTLLAADECHMAVGGGGGRYVGYVTFDNLTFHQLVTGNALASAEMLLCVGGQEGNYPETEVVDRETALRAALHFAETGRLDPRVHWMVK